jgi:hypothetical protein
MGFQLLTLRYGLGLWKDVSFEFWLGWVGWVKDVFLASFCFMNYFKITARET